MPRTTRVHVTYHHNPDTGEWTADSPDQPTLHATGADLPACRADMQRILGRILPNGYRVYETVRLGPPDQPADQ